MLQFDKLTKDDLITLAVSLINLIAKQNYGKAWTSDSDKEGKFLLGIHSPEGEIVAEVPDEYRHHFAGLIETDEPDVQPPQPTQLPAEPVEGQETPEGETPQGGADGQDGQPPVEDPMQPEEGSAVVEKIWAWSETL